MNTMNKPVIPANTSRSSIAISPPNMAELHTTIIGTAPLMIARFSHKSMQAMLEKHVAGSQANKRKAKAARDLDSDFQGARHISTDGWDGIHAGAFRAAMISACRLVGFKMTLAKLSLFVHADGYDRVDATPLVQIIGGEPERSEMPVRNQTGVMDIRIRPVWRTWRVNLRLRYDADQFQAADVMNLLARVGMQVGIGEGRPDSRESAGIGFGLFRIEGEAD
jgi:hypothetical protein